MEFIICWLLFGGICYLLAKEKGLNTTTAAVCGCLFGVFALIYYIAVGKKE
ncbi:MAG: hypothetical protein IKT40_12040 [Bacilli bacterium]|nr:hypothetical protein [Bacilli bacterium]